MQPAHGKIGVWLIPGWSLLYCHYIHGLDGGFLLFVSKSFLLFLSLFLTKLTNLVRSDSQLIFSVFWENCIHSSLIWFAHSLVFGNEFFTIFNVYFNRSQ